MSDAIWVALITGALAIIGDIIISAKSTNDLYAKLDKQSEIADERIKGEIAVIRTEIVDLRKNVEKHNNVLERVFTLETNVARQEEQIKALSNK